MSRSVLVLLALTVLVPVGALALAWRASNQRAEALLAEARAEVAEQQARARAAEVERSAKEPSPPRRDRDGPLTQALRPEAPAGAGEVAVLDLEDIRERLDRIEAQLARLLADSSSADDAGLGALEQRRPAEDWEALEALIHAWNVDERAARARTVLLGYRDVLERYGTPTEIWGERGELNWLYARGRDPVSDAWQEEVWFQFVDGFVVQLGVKQP